MGSQLLRWLWSRQAGDYFFLCTKDSGGRWSDYCIAKGDWGRIDEVLEFEDRDIYFCPRGFTEKRRSEEALAPAKCFWSDLDEVKPESLPIKPSVLIQSSPGRYAGLWFTDFEVDLVLNKSLSYMSGADKSGWDSTQVLRLPGTFNHKPHYRKADGSYPKVKVEYCHYRSIFSVHSPEIKSILSYLAEHPELELVPTEADKADFEEIELDESSYKALLAKVPTKTRVTLLASSVEGSDRSKVLWRILSELTEAGFNQHEVLSLTINSVWNKRGATPNGLRQLRREITKVSRTCGAKSNKSLSGELKAKPSKEDPNVYRGKLFEEESEELFTMPMDEVVQEEANWLWEPYLVKGEITILDGDPGCGKSFLCQMIAKAIIDGTHLPGDKFKRTPGVVMYLDLENSAARVTKPRLVSNGAKNLNLFFQEERIVPLNNEYNLNLLDEAMAKLKPQLFVVDTLATYVGSSDLNKTNEVSLVLNNIKALIRKHDCSAILIRHTVKKSGIGGLQRGMGSNTINGIARTTLSVFNMPGTGIKAMTNPKNNLAEVEQNLTYQVTSDPVDEKKAIFEWLGPTQLTSGELASIQAQMENEAKKEYLDSRSKSKPRHRAVDLIEELVASYGSEPIPSSEVMGLCERHSISQKVVRESVKELGLKSKKIDKIWYYTN